MSKKRSKSPANNAANNSRWEANIVSAELNGTEWNYSLSILVEDNLEDTETIEHIHKGISTGLRRKFSLISPSRLADMITEYGNPKSKKGKEAPADYEVCEHAKSFLDRGETIPASVMARMIKWMMLTAKSNDFKTKDESGKKSETKGSKAKKTNEKPDRSKSSAGKKGALASGKRSPEPPSAKGDTKLRKRGDPDPDIHFIDDDPDDGSSRYFILTGSADPSVIEALAEIGCVVTSIVKVTKDIYIPHPVDEEGENTVDKDNLQNSEEIEEERNRRMSLLRNFWEGIPTTLSTNKNLFNTPIVTLVAKHLMFPIDKNDSEQSQNCSMELFETLAVLMYDLLDLKRQWQNYLAKSKLIELPVKCKEEMKVETAAMESAREEKAPSDDAQAKIETSTVLTFENVDMDYYRFMLQDVAIEDTSIYLQMSAMLDQVDVTRGEKVAEWDKPKSNQPNDLKEETAEMLVEMIDKLYLPKEDLKELRESLQLNNAFKNDRVKRKNEAPIHALDGISLRDVGIDSIALGNDGSMIHELRMLITSFKQFDILNNIPVEDFAARERAARLEELLMYLDNSGLSKIEIHYAIRLFILENLFLSGTDENGIMRVNDEDGVTPRNANQIWDDPFMILEDVGHSIIHEEHKSRETKVDIVEGSSGSSSISLKNSSRSLEGILRSSRSPSHSPEGHKSLRRKSSVHFIEVEKNDLSGVITEGELDVAGVLMDTQDESLQMILLDYLWNVRKRSFSEWCFEEFYEPHVMLQIIQGALYRLPFLDVYNERKTDGKIVVLHNPFQETLRYNHQPWSQWLHANVGFRNYLDFISDKVKDWTRDQEAIYQAMLLNKELQKSEKPKEEEIAKDKPKKGAEKGSKAKLSKSRSRSVSKSSSADESESKEISLILPGSLKAQKMEQEKAFKAREEEERKKEEKRSISAQKKAGKDIAKDKAKRPSSKASNRSKTKKSVIEDVQDQAQLLTDEPLETEREEYWPFVGYDLGDNLAHFSGEVAHLFPSDGCTISIQRTQKLLDSTSVRVSIITTQSHVFSLHIIDPRCSNYEQADDFQKILDQLQSQDSVSRYGASTCVFNDGICLAASNYGYSGSSEKNDKVDTFKEQIIDAGDSPTHRSAENAVEGKSNSLRELQTVEGKCVKRANVDLKELQNLILSSPNGVQVRVGYESDGQDQERCLLLFMTKSEPCSANLQKKEKLQIPKELGRYIMSDGRVVSVMDNDSIKIMFPDSTVAMSSLNVETIIVHEEEVGDLKVEKSNVRETPTQKKKKQPKQSSVEQAVVADPNVVEDHKEIINKQRTWIITKPNGEVYEMKADLNVLDVAELQTKTNDEDALNSPEERDNVAASEVSSLKKYSKNQQQKDSLLISSATDPSSGETLVTRSDGTLLLTTPESGIFLSEHVDKTRFTKYFVLERSLQKESFEDQGEQRIIEIIQIESVNYPMITIDRTNGRIETRCGSMGSLLSTSDGNHCYKHSDGTEIEYRPDGEVIFTAAGNSQMSYLQPYGSSSYVLNTMHNIICEMLDPDGTAFIVDANGNYEVKRSEKENPKEEPSTEEVSEEPPKPTSAISGTSAVNNNEENAPIRKFDQHAPRIFLLNPDGSGSELLRYRDIVDTIVSAETESNYFQYKESIQDHPHIFCHTIMHPTSNTKPWKYDYARKTILPKGLTCRDLKTFPMNEVPKEGPLFAMSIGKGLAIKSNPLEVIPAKKGPSLAKTVSSSDSLQFRQFYHYPLITDEVRNNCALGLVEYNKAILRQRQKYKDLEIKDDRDYQEQIQAEDLRGRFLNMRKVNQQILDNAVYQLTETVQSPHSADGTPKGNQDDQNIKPSKKKLEVLLENNRIDKEKEIENKKRLKNKAVPSYFTSIYGKDFLMNQAVDLKTLNKSMKLFSLSREGTARNENQGKKDSPDSVESSSFSSDTEIENPLNSPTTKQTSKVTKQSYSTTEWQYTTLKKKEKKYVYYDSSLIIPTLPKRMPGSVNLPLPKYLYSERPSVEQNIKQATVEDPVRRKQFTTSVVGGPLIGQIFQRQCRGLNVLPARIDTGLLREGGRYTFKLKLINTGPESSFFKIKQPPTSSGIWVEFTPGPIAAGLSRQITIHVYAIAKNVESTDSRVYLIEEALVITTDTDVLEVPITGRAMTAEKYDLIFHRGDQADETDDGASKETLPPIVAAGERLSVHPGQV